MARVGVSNSGGKSGKGVFPVTKSRWKALILQQMAALGVREPAYDSAVESLAAILEQRDRTYREFQASGGKAALEYTNKAGATNLSKNPLLVLWDDLNKSALAYWRELGLTPSSYRKLTGDAPQKEKPSGLAAALQSLDG